MLPICVIFSCKIFGTFLLRIVETEVKYYIKKILFFGLNFFVKNIEERNLRKRGKKRKRLKRVRERE